MDAPRRPHHHRLDDGTHDRAVLDAEARRLALALSPFGVLHRDALERECRSSSWHQATFKQALARAVETGQIEELPLGFYRLPGHGASSAWPQS